MIDNHSLVECKKKVSHPLCSQNFLPLGIIIKPKVANPASLVEKVLISKLIIGDSSAFSSIFTAYYQDLVMFATRFTHDLNYAEEIVQDTFVMLWEEHESVKIDNSLKSYLLRTVENKCIDWYRHKKVMQTHIKLVIESSPQIEYDTDNYLLHSELQEQIDLSLRLMPETISEAFRLNRYEGRKYHEIADIMKVSVRTIEVRIGKALHFLRNNLKEYFVITIAFLILIL